MGGKQHRRARDWQPEPAPGLSALWRDEASRRLWIRYWLKDTVSGGVDLLLHNGMRLLPIATCSAIGGFLGRTTGRRSRPLADQRIKENLRHFQPGWSEQDVEDAATRLWDHLGRTMAEFSVVDKLLEAGRVSVRGQTQLQQALHDGPVILLGLHVGNWEVLVSVLAASTDRAYTLYEPPRSRFKRAIAIRARQRCGIRLLPPGKAGALPFMRALQPGAGAMIFGDEDFGGAIQAPLFGRPVHAEGNLAYAVRFALKRRATILPFYCTRTEGCRFEVRIAPPIRLDNAGTDGEGLLANVQRLNDAIEPVVRARLDQWYWLPTYRPSA